MRDRRELEHIRFLLWHGMWPWGVATGVIAAALVMVSEFHQRADGQTIGVVSILLIGATCFVLWTALIGAGVGGFLWSTRDLAHSPRPRDRHPTRSGKRPRGKKRG